MQQGTAIRAHAITRSAMDRAIDEHFAYEGRDDVAGVLATLSDDVDHDIVGSPTGPLRGKGAVRAFYEQLFADLRQERVTSKHRYYGEDFVVDESVWRGTAVGNPLGFAGRNRPLQFRILHLFEFGKAGAIRRENVWMDTGAIAAQLDVGAPDSAAGHGATAAQLGAKETVMAFYAAFDQGSLRSFRGIGAAFEAKVFGATVLDWPGFLAFGEAFREGFPDGRHVFDFVIAEGDSVATIGHYRGRHTQHFMGVAATRREVDFTVMHVDRVQDGRIVEHRGIGDINTMWSQLGVTPPGSDRR
ncbi:MAG: ester cyclase [Burkholderiales bacterium]|nr:ester cyclase [Burkholderiales bacterium]